ncbi:MAG: hypothetical protein MUD14_04920, partial [Hydrococcus sp. Prado102]|nr:hypothetical protein [Hydrococcus sp. Prado102]
FVVYCAVGRKFRDTLRTLCQREAGSGGVTGKTSVPEVSETEPLALGGCMKDVMKNGAQHENTFLAVAAVADVDDHINADNSGQSDTQVA